MSLTKQDYIDAIDIAIEQKDREVADGLINEFENLYVKKEKKNNWQFEEFFDPKLVSLF